MIRLSRFLILCLGLIAFSVLTTACQGGTKQARPLLLPRLAEALPYPLLEAWAGALWQTGVQQELIGELSTGGDCLGGYWVHLTETKWVEVLTGLLTEAVIQIATNG